MPFLRNLRIAVAGLCLLTAAACTGTSTSAGTGLVSFAPAVRKAAPDLSGITIGQGSSFSLAAQKGHVVVINFWASWCDPCRDELPYLDQAATEFQPDGVVFMGVSFHGDPKSAAQTFLRSNKVPYDSLSDPDSKWVLAFASHKVKITIASPPLTMVIDKQGRIADVFNGEVVYSQLRDTIAQEQGA